MNWTQLPLQFALGGGLSFAICYTVMRALIGVQREHIQELSHERNDYRTKLHNCREDAEATSLKLLELQSRPDLHDLGEVIADNTRALTLLIAKLTSRDVVFDRIEKAFEHTSETLGKLNELIEGKVGI